MKLNFKSIINTLKDVREYIFPVKKFVSKFQNINSEIELKNFIQERSAHVTQTTLYGYIKTRIGTRYPIMLEDDKFSNSINIAKWNIYVIAIADCTFYTYSYLYDKKNFRNFNVEKVYLDILETERNNGLNEKVFINAKSMFNERVQKINWNTFHSEKPFQQSSLALYKWSPIADELKELDKEIVLNSIKLKWNIVENEFKELTNS